MENVTLCALEIHYFIVLCKVFDTHRAAFRFLRCFRYIIERFLPPFQRLVDLLELIFDSFDRVAGSNRLSNSLRSTFLDWCHSILATLDWYYHVYHEMIEIIWSRLSSWWRPSMWLDRWDYCVWPDLWFLCVVIPVCCNSCVLYAIESTTIMG